jgi:hypothetical protein
MKFKIAIIEPNDLFFSDLDMRPSRFEKERIIDEIEDYVTFKQVENTEEMMGIIIETLNLEKGGEGEIYNKTYTCYQTDDTVYQLCYSYSPNDLTNKNKKNGVASYLNEENITLYGSCVLLKSKILSDNTCVPLTININDTVDVFISQFIHKGVIINTDGNLQNFTYMKNPAECLSQDERSNVKFYEYDIFGKIFMLFIEVNPTNNLLNEYASILAYKKINGRVLVAIRNKDEFETDHTYYNYNNIDEKYLRKILTILSDKNEERELTSNENINATIEKATGKKMYTNFYRIVDNRYNDQSLSNTKNMIKTITDVFETTLNDETKQKIAK